MRPWPPIGQLIVTETISRMLPPRIAVAAAPVPVGSVMVIGGAAVTPVGQVVMVMPVMTPPVTSACAVPPGIVTVGLV